MKITVVGAGYVGISLATLLAVNHTVKVLEINKKKVTLINKRIPPIADEGLIFYFKKPELKLYATTSEVEAYLDPDVIFICVPTNLNKSTKRLDLSIVEKVISNIARKKSKAVIVIKSTISIGFTEKMQIQYPELAILFSPEFLREGTAVYDTQKPSRLVVGCTKKGQNLIAKKIVNLLEGISLNTEGDVVICNSREAECIKLFANAYLAMRVAFFNELDSFAMENNLDPRPIIKGVSLDQRIGNYYNNPSFGYGGNCLPKDSEELKSTLRILNTPLIKNISLSNSKRINFIVKKILEKLLSIKCERKVVGIYGLGTKKGSKEMRNSIVLEVLKMLNKAKINIILFEPGLNKNEYEGYPIYTAFEDFKKDATIIVANRIDTHLKDIDNIVFTRDLYNRD